MAGPEILLTSHNWEKGNA